MALRDDAFDALAARFGEQTAQRATEAFERLWSLLQADEALSPREAALQVQQEFARAWTADLASAFSALLARSVGVGELLAMQVGDLTLSRRLYLHAEQTAAEVAALVREHAQGVQQARELALRLYDGYDPKDGIVRPLEGRARVIELPKALRVIATNSSARQSLAQLIERGQRQAARLKSPALRAAYMEAFDAWAAGAGREALRSRLWVAQQEKNRYTADRIAQTELARAHQAQVGAELMADPTIDVVQVAINPTHPRADICDLHGRADLWGLGPGCYPKARAPRPAFHPFCRCKLRSRPSLSAAGARQVQAGEAAYLRSLSPQEAARVMGSADRAQRVLEGASFDVVVNAGRPDAYRLARLGDGSGHPLVR